MTMDDTSFDEMPMNMNLDANTILEWRWFFEELRRCVKAYLYHDSEADDLISLIKTNASPTFSSRFQRLTQGFWETEKKLLLVLASHMQRKGVIAWRTTAGMAADAREEMDSAVADLLDRGIVVTIPDDSDVEKRSQLGTPVILSQNAFKSLFEGLADFVNLTGSLAGSGKKVQCSDIVSKALYYDRDTQKEVDRLLAALSPTRFDGIMDYLSRLGRRRSVSCLLYGPPGTGKTELALQTARSTGRNIIQADIAKMTGSYVGESERNYRLLFTAYRYAVLIAEAAPILLLNEADSFFSRRIQVVHALDKYENNLQNILLEELESFEGILMATTNHTEGMDEAYDRRFFMKVKLGIPGSETRHRIWRNTMPALPEEDISFLAERFRMTGAQINNVVARYDFLTALDEHTPSFNELVELCAAEEGGSIGRQRKRIGYK